MNLICKEWLDQRKPGEKEFLELNGALGKFYKLFQKSNAPIVSILKPLGTNVQDYVFEKDLIKEMVLKKLQWIDKPKVTLVVKQSTRIGAR